MTLQVTRRRWLDRNFSEQLEFRDSGAVIGSISDYNLRSHLPAPKLSKILTCPTGGSAHLGKTLAEPEEREGFMARRIVSQRLLAKIANILEGANQVAPLWQGERGCSRKTMGCGCCVTANVYLAPQTCSRQLAHFAAAQEESKFDVPRRWFFV